MKKAAVWFAIGYWGVPFVTKYFYAWRDRGLNRE